jgi:hypothetical protein
MDTDPGAIAVGLLMTVFGIIGLVLIAGAADDEMYIFGIALTLFAILFDFGLIRRHYDRRDALLAQARTTQGGGGHHV